MPRRNNKSDLTGLPLLMWLPERKGHDPEGDFYHKLDAIDGSGMILYTITFPENSDAVYELFFQARYENDSILFLHLDDAKRFAERNYQVVTKLRRALKSSDPR